MKGILITVSDDAMAGDGSAGSSPPRTKPTQGKRARLGLKEAIFLNYPNHNMDAWPIVEMRARWYSCSGTSKWIRGGLRSSGLYERNPDHYVPRAPWNGPRALRHEVGLSGVWLAGVKPYPVNERYYFSRGPQLVNRVVDISDYIDQKVWVNLANVTQGPSGKYWR